MSQPFTTFNFNRREATCFGIAIAVHMLLLLWKGVPFQLAGSGSDALGEAVIQVSLLNQMPEYPETGGGEAGPKRGILSRVKNFFTKKPEPPAAKKAEEPAMGQSGKIDVDKSQWTKVDQALKDKNFAGTPSFKGMDNKADVLVAAGNTTLIAAKSKNTDTTVNAPALQNKAFVMAAKDTPFAVKSARDTDALANVNAVPIHVGGTTSKNVKISDSEMLAGTPALQSKTLSGGGTSRSGFGQKPGGAGGGGDSGALAMGGGGGSGSAPIASGLGGEGLGGGDGSNTSGYGAGGGYGTGTGGGSGGGGVGEGSGPGSGRRSMVSFGSQVAALPRHSVAADQEDKVSSSGGATNSNDLFIITGQLAGRGIVSKKLTPYEMDARIGLRFRVDAQGRVLDGIVIVLSSGSPTFDRKVLNDLKKWIFVPLPAERSREVQEGIVTFRFIGV